MKRGQIVSIVADGGDAAAPRTGLVVQADPFNVFHPAVTVCPITRQASGDSLYRVTVGPTEAAGLPADAEVEIDLVQAVRRERIGAVVGHAADETMFTVDQALRRWLSL